MKSLPLLTHLYQILFKHLSHMVALVNVSISLYEKTDSVTQDIPNKSYLLTYAHTLGHHSYLS